LNSISAPLRKRIIDMLVAFILVMLCGIASWLFFSLVAYSLIYGSLIFSYCVVWDDRTRRAICPHGLLSAILYDH
jgi:hypothetical protein